MARVSLGEAVRRPTSSNGATPPGAGVVVTTPVRRRPTWVLLGAGLVALAMLLGAWVFATDAHTTAVLVAAEHLARPARGSTPVPSGWWSCRMRPGCGRSARVSRT